jgi:Tfp pilus assembly protein PilO
MATYTAVVIPSPVSHDTFISFLAILLVGFIIFKFIGWAANGFSSNEAKLEKILKEKEKNDEYLAQLYKEKAENAAQLEKLYKEKAENDRHQIENINQLLADADEMLLKDIKEFIKAANESFDITHDKQEQNEQLKLLMETIDSMGLPIQGSIDSLGHLVLTNRT